jgi:His-Xaa-Ser system radical SAM maturase HxsB
VERSVTLAQPEMAADNLGFFRWGSIGGRVLITSDSGDWDFLSEGEFADLLAGRIGAGHPRFTELQRKGFIRDGLDLDAFAARMTQRNRHLRRGLRIHVVNLTQRRSANGEAASGGADMSREVAEQVIDLALQSTASTLTFELQGDGGEPLLNFEVLQHFVDYAKTRNQRSTGKALTFKVLTNFTAMTEDIAEWLIANDVQVTTSLDGPASIHDPIRAWKGGSAHADVVRWIEYCTRRYDELDRDPALWHVDALITVTRHSLGAWREIVDEYVARGMRTILLRPLNRARFDAERWKAIGYTAEEYLDFYRHALDYIIQLNRKGTAIVERMASIFATKILTADDPGILDIQSPNGAGTGQVAYEVDGRVFPSDEARIVDAGGDAMFELGHVRTIMMSELHRHPTVRAIAAASLLDVQPQCTDCWNKPFCGFSPVRNVITQGDLIGQRPLCLECKEHKAIATQIFEILGHDGDAEPAGILRGWTTTNPRLASDGRASKEAP